MCRIRLSPCLPALLVVATGTTAISGSHSDAGAGPSHPASLSLPQRFWAGGASRTVSQLVLYPVDAMRTLAQTRTGAKTLQDLGASVLVSGCLTTSAFALVVGAMQFAIIGACEPIFGNIGASVLGALGSCLASVPQEVIKQRLVTGIYPDFFSAVTTIYSAEGVAGFYTAWLPTVWRNVPFVVVTFTAFGELKRRRLNACGSLSVVDNLKIGDTRHAGAHNKRDSAFGNRCIGGPFCRSADAAHRCSQNAPHDTSCVRATSVQGNCRLRSEHGSYRRARIAIQRFAATLVVHGAVMGSSVCAQWLHYRQNGPAQ